MLSRLHLIRHALLPKMHTLKAHLGFFSIFSGHISRMCTLFFSIGRGLSGGIGIRPCQKRQQSEGCTKVLYMSSSFWLLGVESRDFSHAEKKKTACKAEQIHKITTIFNQNGPRLSL